MSSPSGRTLEAFVEEGLLTDTTEEIKAWIEFFENERDCIEASISGWYADDADGGACSWRDFRNNLWETYETYIQSRYGVMPPDGYPKQRFVPDILKGVKP